MRHYKDVFFAIFGSHKLQDTLARNPARRSWETWRYTREKPGEKTGERTWKKPHNKTGERTWKKPHKKTGERTWKKPHNKTGRSILHLSVLVLRKEFSAENWFENSQKRTKQAVHLTLVTCAIGYQHWESTLKDMGRQTTAWFPENVTDVNLQKLGKIVSKKRFETKHEGVSYSCQQCEDKVAQRGNVKEHKESRRSRRSLYSCDHCGDESRW